MFKPVVVSQSSVSGGAEAYLTRLYSLLAGRGAAPALIGSIPLWESAGLERRPLKLGPKWGGTTMFSGALRLPGERKRLGRNVDLCHADFFHVQFKREQIGFTDVLSKRAPVVWTEHGRFLRGPKGALLAAGYRAAAKKAAVIICVSEEVAADTRRVVGQGPRIEVIENAVDTTTLTPASAADKLRARLALGVVGDAPVLLWIGRLHSTKRAEFAVELAKAWPGPTLIAGDGPLRRHIDAAAADVPSARVLGHVGNTASLYHAADVMAFTSTGASEGYPTTTMVEAGAHGVPFVTDGQSRAGRAVLASGGVVLAAGASSSEWARALRESISESRREVVRKWAEEHDVELWAQKHIEIFDSVILTRKQRRL